VVVLEVQLYSVAEFQREATMWGGEAPMKWGFTNILVGLRCYLCCDSFKMAYVGSYKMPNNRPGC
jgi:hypothetical protein